MDPEAPRPRSCARRRDSLEKRSRIVRPRHRDSAVENEERHGADAGGLRFAVLRLNLGAKRVRCEQRAGAFAIEARGLRDGGKLGGFAQRPSIDEKTAE